MPASAKTGGASCLVSGAEIYNEILRRRPDLAPLLFEPFHWDWKRQDHNGPANTYTSPIVSIVDGVFMRHDIFETRQPRPERRCLQVEIDEDESVPDLDFSQGSPFFFLSKLHVVFIAGAPTSVPSRS